MNLQQRAGAKRAWKKPKRNSGAIRQQRSIACTQFHKSLVFQPDILPPWWHFLLHRSLSSPKMLFVFNIMQDNQPLLYFTVRHQETHSLTNNTNKSFFFLPPPAPLLKAKLWGCSVLLSLLTIFSSLTPSVHSKLDDKLAILHCLSFKRQYHNTKM